MFLSFIYLKLYEVSFLMLFSHSKHLQKAVKCFSEMRFQILIFGYVLVQYCKHQKLLT